MNSEHCITVLSKFYSAFRQMRGVDRDSQSFQQDGAMPHSSNASLRKNIFQEASSAGLTMIELPADMAPPEFIHGDFRKTMYTMMNLGQLLL